MIEEIVNSCINNVINTFDFSYCIVTNVATYLMIKLLQDINIKYTTTWYKRLIFLFIALIISLVYYKGGVSFRVIINSIIIAPVSWSWIFKPLCAKFNIDYKH